MNATHHFMKSRAENRINFVSTGAGEPILLIHGIAASLHDWDSISLHLNDAGYETYALDLPGHGLSSKPDEDNCYNVDDLIRIFVDWVDTLKLEQRPIVIGHSLGGYLGLEYALRCPLSTRALVLIDPFYTPDQIPHFLRDYSPDNLLGVLNRLKAPGWLFDLIVEGTSFLIPGRYFLKHDLPKETRKQMSKDFQLAAPGVFRLPFTARNLGTSMAQLSVPTLVVYGTRDLTMDPKSYDRLVSKLPKAMGVGLKAGHIPHRSNADEILPLVLNFIRHLPND